MPDSLDPRLHSAGQDLRALLKSTVDRIFNLDFDADEDMWIRRHWATALCVLSWDILGSVLSLLLDGQRRAPMMLNRSLFEYQIRYRYYDANVDTARRSMGQVIERFRRMHRANPDAIQHGMNAAELDEWLNARGVIERENFKRDVLQEVVGEAQVTQYYDGYYGKVSGWIHGYEVILIDVHPLQNFDTEQGVVDVSIDWHGAAFKVNKQALLAITAVATLLEAVETRFGGEEINGFRASMKSLAQTLYAEGINLWA